MAGDTMELELVHGRRPRPMNSAFKLLCAEDGSSVVLPPRSGKSRKALKVGYISPPVRA